MTHKFSIDDFGPKRGRPATGQNPQTKISWPWPLLARIDAFAATEFVERADVIRMLVEKGLDHEAD
jgi:hypothetical protein